MIKKRLLSSILITVLGLMTLTGCSTERFRPTNSIDDLTEEGVINEQTSENGIKDQDIFDKKGNVILTDNSYYILHDGVYYPVYSYLNNYENKDVKDFVEPNRMEFFTTENEINIPTLFLDQGDKLIYYSTSSLLDYIIWERYYDMGYTVGCFDIKTLTNNRCYLDLSETIPLVPDSELYSIVDLQVDEVLLDKIGGVNITSDMVDNGILIGATKSANYDMEVYAGTYYNHYLATANVHAMKAYELYATVDYLTLQTNIYEVTIPDYFVDGYYKVDETGMFRLVREGSYSEETDFNKQVLFPIPNEDKPDEYVAPQIYSDFAELNKFKTETRGTLGFIETEITDSGNQYKDPDAEVEPEELKEATITELEIWCPKEYRSTITIQSASRETTGDIYVDFGDEVVRVNYDYLVGAYTTTFEGGDRKGTLIVTGLFNDYDIILKGCYEYAGSEQEAIDKAAIEATQTEDIPSTTEEETTTTDNPPRR